jgi:hypothetical protein
MYNKLLILYHQLSCLLLILCPQVLLQHLHLPLVKNAFDCRMFGQLLDHEAL